MGNKVPVPLWIDLARICEQNAAISVERVLAGKGFGKA